MVRSLSFVPFQENPFRLAQLGTKREQRTTTRIKQEGKGTDIARTPRARWRLTHGTTRSTARLLRGDA